MRPLQKAKTLILAAAISAATAAFAVSPAYQDALQARIENGYAIVRLANGSKTMVPLASLKPDDRAWLTNLSVENPLSHGKSEVRVVREQVPVKKTIAVSTTVGALETVQLNPPNVLRDQIGGTCMVYARVHWLDIAGYYVDNADIYRIINNADPDNPCTTPGYYNGMLHLVTSFTPHPIVHNWTPKFDKFEWTREELRKGRPVLAAFPREIWQALPPGFVGEHPWSGGNVGHQIVVNGFTWNSETHQGTFHIVNSWTGLFEFDLNTEVAKGAMVVEQSLSPRGEMPEQAEKTRVSKITLVKAVGRVNLYEAETNNGVERVAAPDEGAARYMIENGDSGR